MQWLPSDPDIYTIFGGLLATISAIFTIVSGVGQLFSPVIASNKLNLLAKAMESETNLERKKALETARLQIESSVISREIVPWWRFGMNALVLIVLGFHVAYPPPTDATDAKEVEYAVTGLAGGTVAVAYTFHTLQERLRASHQYRCGENPYSEANKQKVLHFFKRPKAWMVSVAVAVISIALLILSDHALNSSLPGSDLGGYFIFTTTGYLLFLYVMASEGRKIALENIQQATKQDKKKQATSPGKRPKKPKK